MHQTDIAWGMLPQICFSIHVHCTKGAPVLQEPNVNNWEEKHPGLVLWYKSLIIWKYINWLQTTVNLMGS